MDVCRHTGVSVPECSCGACVQALIDRHGPAGQAAEAGNAGGAPIASISARRLASKLRSLGHRRAA
jgi:hypothetical protein